MLEALSATQDRNALAKRRPKDLKCAMVGFRGMGTPQGSVHRGASVRVLRRSQDAPTPGGARDRYSLSSTDPFAERRTDGATALLRRCRPAVPRLGARGPALGAARRGTARAARWRALRGQRPGARHGRPAGRSLTASRRARAPLRIGAMDLRDAQRRVQEVVQDFVAQVLVDQHVALALALRQAVRPVLDVVLGLHAQRPARVRKPHQHRGAERSDVVAQQPQHLVDRVGDLDAAMPSRIIAFEAPGPVHGRVHPILQPSQYRPSCDAASHAAISRTAAGCRSRPTVRAAVPTTGTARDRHLCSSGGFTLGANNRENGRRTWNPDITRRLPPAAGCRSRRRRSCASRCRTRARATRGSAATGTGGTAITCGFPVTGRAHAMAATGGAIAGSCAKAAGTSRAEAGSSTSAARRASLAARRSEAAMTLRGYPIGSAARRAVPPRAKGTGPAPVGAEVARREDRATAPRSR